MMNARGEQGVSSDMSSIIPKRGCLNQRLETAPYREHIRLENGRHNNGKSPESAETSYMQPTGDGKLSAVKSLFNKLGKTVNCIGFIVSIGNYGNGSSLGDSERKNAEKTLCINAAIVLFYPNRTFVGICLLDKERSRAGVETNAIFHRYVASNH